MTFHQSQAEREAAKADRAAWINSIIAMGDAPAPAASTGPAQTQTESPTAPEAVSIMRAVLGERAVDHSKREKDAARLAMGRRARKAVA